eukprot:100662-Rhodomonas_salina.1
MWVPSVIAHQAPVTGFRHDVGAPVKHAGQPKLEGVLGQTCVTGLIGCEAQTVSALNLRGGFDPAFARGNSFLVHTVHVWTPFSIASRARFLVEVAAFSSHSNEAKHF